MANEQFSSQQLRQIDDMTRKLTSEFSEMLGDVIVEYGDILGGKGDTAEARRKKRAAKAEGDHTDAIDDDTSKTRKHTSAVDDSTDAFDDVAKAAEKARKETEEGRKGMRAFGQDLGSAGSALGNWGARLVSFMTISTGLLTIQNEMKAALASGGDVSPWESAKMGVTPTDLIELQKTFRQTALAGADGVAGFTSSVARLQDDLILRTGGMKEAAFLAADMTDLSQSMGVRLSAISDNTIPGLMTAFGKMQDQVGMTGDEFMKMNRSLIADSDVREVLLRLNEDQRESYILGLNKQALAMTKIGLTTSEAEAAVKRINKIGTEDPMERMKKAAKLQAMAGAYGLGSEGSKAADIMRKGSRATSDEKKQLTTLMSTISSTINRSMGDSMASEIVGARMKKLVGMENLSDYDMSDKIGKKHASEGIAQQQSQLLKSNMPVKEIIQAVDTVNATLKNGVAILAGALLLSSVKGKLAKHLVGAFGQSAIGKKGKGLAMGAMMQQQMRDSTPSKGKLIKNLGGKVGIGAIAAIAGHAALSLYNPESQAGANTKAAAGSSINAAGYAATGAMLGSIVPGIGTLAGAIVGGVVGGTVSAAVEFYDWLEHREQKAHEAEMNGINERHAKLMSGLNSQKAVDKASKVQAAEEGIQRAKLLSTQSAWLKNAVANEGGLGRFGGLDDLDSDEIADKLGMSTDQFYNKLLDLQGITGETQRAAKKRGMIEGNTDDGFNTSKEKELLASLIKQMDKDSSTQKKAAEADLQKTMDSIQAIITKQHNSAEVGVREMILELQEIKRHTMKNVDATSNIVIPDFVKLDDVNTTTAKSPTPVL